MNDAGLDDTGAMRMHGPSESLSIRVTRFLAGFGRARNPRSAPDRARGAQRFAALLAAVGRTPANARADHQPAAPRQALRVDSGLHRGATLDLAAREYLIGADAACDIVLRDPALAQRQWRLVPTAAGFGLWEGEAGSGTRVPAQGAADVSGWRESSFDLAGVRLTLLRALEPPRPDAAPSAAARRTRATRARLVSMLAVGAVVTTVAFAAARWHDVATRPDLPQRIVRGGQALAAQGFEAVRFREGRRGELEVAGLVAGAVDRDKLKAWLARSDYADARSNVQQADSLVEQMRQTLAGEDLRISHHGRRVLVEGSTGEPAVKQRIGLLAQELAGVVDIDDRVVQVDPPPSPKPPEPLPVHVRDVMLGEPNYFRTDSGAYYYEGALLPDGAEVLAIEAKQIRFRRDNKIIVFALE